MEDKVFVFMEKMYADLKSEIQSVKSELKSEIQSVSNHVIRLEHEHGSKLNALLDGYKQLSEGQQEIKRELVDIKEHMAHQDNEITFLKKVK
ncbi:MAG: hypothetical protein GX625_08110 [Clostridiaceae bacterium]|nr:hypothetical protein [Clostridiaceae bacterium]